jgi:hypothetical protein
LWFLKKLVVLREEPKTRRARHGTQSLLPLLLKDTELKAHCRLSSRPWPAATSIPAESKVFMTPPRNLAGEVKHLQ